MFARAGVETLSLLSAVAVLFLACPTGAKAEVEEVGIESLWYFGFGLGHLQYEGDEEVADSVGLSLQLGYDFNERWTLEGTLLIAPSIDGNERYDIPTGTTVNRLEEKTGQTDTSAWGLSVDGLYHFTRWERVDPFLTLGAAVLTYDVDFGGGKSDFSLRGGAGVMYHFNDEWAVRTDIRTFFAGADTEANAVVSVGAVWTWGAGVPFGPSLKGGPKDSDADGLSDIDEERYHTEVLNPDTDDDGLFDGPEVHTHRTDPLNPDSDVDGLKDGREVKIGTDPLKRDTDDGGVADGHEVIEDGTDPLVGADDLIMFTLYIKFDVNSSVVKPAYFSELDKIAKVMRRHAGSTARVEGHADKRKTSSKEHNDKLSANRASAVKKYLAGPAGLGDDRVSSVGYGFSRPVAENNPKTGNDLNRRVEVYIRKDGASESVGGDSSIK